MLVFTQTFVSFFSQGDHLSDDYGLLIIACVSFSRYNLIPLTIFPNRYNVYQNSHYLGRSYKLFLFYGDKNGKKFNLKTNEHL